MRICVVIMLAVLCLFASGCQTAHDMTLAYRDATYSADQFKSTGQTSVLFLVDGLSSEILKTSLRSGNVPRIADAFTLSTKARFTLGRAQFPSLTFPNMTSILLGAPVSDHPITGNRIVFENHLINFENPANWNDLARLVQRQTIFAKLQSQSLSSVSYAYAFAGAATASQQKSIEAGVSYLESDYASIDLTTLSSLRHLLTGTQVSKWPRFIFVHLVGIDALAHTHGPSSETVQTYLHELDANLGVIFDLLDHPNGLSYSTHKVNYALTADHGFRTTTLYSPLGDIVSRLNRKVRFVPDNRSAGLHIDEPMSDAQKLSFAHGLLDVENVEWAAVKSESAIDLLRKTKTNVRHARITFADGQCAENESAAHFEWLDEIPLGDRPLFTCLSDYTRTLGADDDSFIVPALVDYFASPTSPDIAFVPSNQADFASGYAGNHGGLTREEMLVPVLIKNVDLPRGIRPTYELLRHMGLQK